MHEHEGYEEALSDDLRDLQKLAINHKELVTILGTTSCPNASLHDAQARCDEPMDTNFVEAGQLEKPALQRTSTSTDVPELEVSLERSQIEAGGFKAEFLDNDQRPEVIRGDRRH